MFTFTSIYYDTRPTTGRCLDIWMPDEATQEHVIFFIHGGGWLDGRRNQMHPLMSHFRGQGFICVTADYRLDGMTISEQLVDIRDGLIAARCHLLSCGFNKSFVLYGSSAGGHLALLSGVAGAEFFSAVSKDTLPRLAGVIASCAPVSFEPWDDIFPGAWDIMQKAAGDSFERSPELYRRLSPATYFDRNLPPLLFLMGECEHMFPNHVTIRQVERLKFHGNKAFYHVYQNAEHGFFYDVERRAQKRAFRDILLFLRGIPSFEETNSDCHLVALS